MPVTDDAARLWALWVGQQGGEGIVPKERSASYRPGRRVVLELTPAPRT